MPFKRSKTTIALKSYSILKSSIEIVSVLTTKLRFVEKNTYWHTFFSKKSFRILNDFPNLILMSIYCIIKVIFHAFLLKQSYLKLPDEIVFRKLCENIT